MEGGPVRLLRRALKRSTMARGQILKADAPSFDIPSPRFDLQVASAKTYDRLFDFTNESLLREEQLLASAISSGRVLVAGRGGGGKTVFMKRCALQCADLGYVAVFVSLKFFNQEKASSWLSLQSRLSKIDFLLRNLNTAEIGIAELDSLSPAVKRILFIDGLNEVESKVAQELIFCLDEYAGTAISTSVIVSDRLVRREFVSPERWALYAIQPLSSQEISSLVRPGGETITASQQELLTSPFFLNLYLSNRSIASTSAAEIDEWFLEHSLAPEEVLSSAEAAYRVYGRSSRSFLLDEFEVIAGESATQKLLSSGGLTISGNDALFDHHLKHDFLASRYLAEHRQLWSKEAFDHVTFSGSSFDAIMMCLEQVPQHKADNFIRSVYDWNLYGVGYSLSESRHHNVSEEMRRVMIAMFAERLWDPIQPTAIKARDTLKLLRQDPDSQRFLHCRTLEDVLDFIRTSWQGPSWFLQWRDLFATRVRSEVSDAVQHFIEEEDSVIGWTVANVLRRCVLTEVQQANLRNLVSEAPSVVRWRAAHTLGAFPSQENLQALTQALQNEDRLVRYGGLRSCFESAAQASEPLRGETFAMLKRNSHLILGHSSLKDEMRRAMLIPQAKRPDSWVKCCIDLISTWQSLESSADQEKWTRTAQSLFELAFVVNEPERQGGYDAIAV